MRPAHATIDDALSFALEAADPYVKEGFTVREDYWGGDLPVKTTKAIVHQLFKGNEYWFWMGTDPEGGEDLRPHLRQRGQPGGSRGVVEAALRRRARRAEEDRLLLFDRGGGKIAG